MHIWIVRSCFFVVNAGQRKGGCLARCFLKPQPSREKTQMLPRTLLSKTLTRGSLYSLTSPHSTATALKLSSTTSTNVKSPRLFSKRKLPFIDSLFVPAPTVEEAVDNILYNNPTTVQTPVNRHTLNCLVANEPVIVFVVVL